MTWLYHTLEPQLPSFKTLIEYSLCKCPPPKLDEDLSVLLSCRHAPFSEVPGTVAVRSVTS